MNEALAVERGILLDTALNLGRINSPEEAVETAMVLVGKERNEIIATWEDLVKDGTVIQKDYNWFIRQPNETKKTVSEFLFQAGVTADKVTDLVETRIQEKPDSLNLLIQVLNKISRWGAEKSIIFSDGEWTGQLGGFCDQLVKDRMAFQHSSSSRKHSYRTFIIRTWPFDCEEIIRTIILKHLNVEGLTDEEWQAITLLLFALNFQIDYSLMETNVNFTKSELREIITKLKQRGLVKEEYGRVMLSAGLNEPLSQYFKLNFYPKRKSATVSSLKQRVGRNISTLWLLLTAKQIYDSPEGEIKTEPIPCKNISRANIKEFEPYLEDMKRLGIVFDFGTNVIVMADVIAEIENWLRGSIKESLVFIPARDFYLARSVFQDVFSKCVEYVKIQDGYIGEETFDIIEYVPPELRIQFLTSVNGSDRGEAADVISRIERLQSERRGKFHIMFVGDQTTGEAPFHDRFILSKDVGWQVGTSLKQVGKGKDSTVSQLTSTEKNEHIEPAFDRWWQAKLNELELKHIRRLSFLEWKELMTISKED